MDSKNTSQAPVVLTPAEEVARNKTKLSIVTHALLFVVLSAVLNSYFLFGTAAAIHAVLIIVTAVVSAFFAHTIFYMFFDGLEKTKFSSFAERIKSTVPRTLTGAPLVTALIIGLGVQPSVPLYVVGVATILAEILVKLLFGGFGQNIFNPAAFAFLFIAVSFGNTAIVTPYLPDVMSSATPLAGLNAANWIMTAQEAQNFVVHTGGLGRMLVGQVPGSLGETSRLAMLIACAYITLRKAADWVLPTVYLVTIFIITFIYALIIGTDVLLYPVIHLLTGGVIFGAVFMATDPITTPKNKTGKIIWAIGLAMFTLLIRFNSGHSEGVSFSILLMCILTPLIDTKTTSEKAKKAMPVIVTFIVAVGVVIGLTLLMNNA